MKTFFSLALLAVSNTLLACPYCAGNTDAPDRNTWLILTIFIVMTYIPFFLLFRVAFKKKKKQ